jgi:hypothetical protein
MATTRKINRTTKNTTKKMTDKASRTTEAACAADISTATTMAKGGDNVQAPASPSTHPIRVEPKTTCEDDDDNNNDDVAVGGDRRDDNGTTAMEAAWAADALIGDDAPLPAPAPELPLTHLSKAALTTTSNKDDNGETMANSAIVTLPTMIDKTTAGVNIAACIDDAVAPARTMTATTTMSGPTIAKTLTGGSIAGTAATITLTTTTNTATVNTGATKPTSKENITPPPKKRKGYAQGSGKEKENNNEVSNMINIFF